MLPLSPVYIVPLGLVVFGSPFVAIGVRSQRENAAVRNWPQVKGRIATSVVRTFTSQRLDTFDRNWAPNSPNNQGQIRNETYYSADARFAYEVDGQACEGTKISREGVGGTQQQVQAWVDRHPPGTEVSVYVDPHDPTTAYIELSRRSVGALILLIWGGVFVFAGVLVFVISCWSDPETKSAEYPSSEIVASKKGTLSAHGALHKIAPVATHAAPLGGTSLGGGA